MQPLINQYNATATYAGVDADLFSTLSFHGDSRKTDAEAESQDMQWSDLASRTGFIASVVFLCVTALYGLSLASQWHGLRDGPRAILNEIAANAGFAIRAVKIEGANHLAESSVHEALALNQTRSLIFFDTDDARQRLLSLGWVENAEVKRLLPGAVEVKITERKVYARWRQPSGAIAAISRDGNILEGDTGSRFETLPLVSGGDAAREAPSLIEKLDDHKELALRIAEAEWTAGQHWTLTIKNGPRVKLSRNVTDFSLSRLAGITGNNTLMSRPVTAIDLRFPKRIILEIEDKSTAMREKLITELTQSTEPAASAEKGKRAL